MPKISELNAITSVANNDLLMVVHDPGGLPSTNKVTVNNFARSITTSLNYANNTTAGVIKVGDYLSINSTGFLNGQASGGQEGVYSYTLIDSANNYTVANTDVILFVDANAVDQNVRIVLPTSGLTTGQEFLIKNINPGANHKVTVITDAGQEFNSNYLEDPVTGGFIVSYDISVKGESHTWIWDGAVFRHLAELSSAPIFYASTDSYHQVVIANPSNANNASSDWVAYNNQGNYQEGTGPFIDMGINSNTYTDTTYGNVWGPSDAYVYNYGGNLIIGPQTDHTIKFVAGNTNVEDVRMTISSSDITVNSNIHATQSYFDIYGRTLAEISASTDGLGSGPQQAYVWAYQDGDSDVQTGMYSQNSSSESQFVQYPDGRINFTGYNGIENFNYNYTIRPYSAYSVGIRPTNSFGNELVINPTADYDIHLYEGNTGGAITLGNPGYTQFRVYGPGGANNGGGQYGNDIRAEMYGNSTFSILANSYQWAFNSDGSISIPSQSHIGYRYNSTITGPTLRLSNDLANEVIVTGPSPNSTFSDSQRIVIQGQRGYGTWGQNVAGEGGDIYLWAGVGGESDTGVGGTGGDIKVRGGQGQDNEGGYVKIEAGDAAFWNGSSLGNGGFIEITAGDVIESGGNANNVGGSVTISAGRARSDSTKSGAVKIRAGGNVNSPTQNEWVFNANNILILPANSDIKNSDGFSVIKSIPQNQQSSFSDYTLQLSDAGRHVYKDDGDGYGVVVPTNDSVAFEIGTVITIVSGNGWTYIYAADSMTTEVWGAGFNQTSTSFYIPNNSMATLLKIGTDKWMLSGAGLAID
jgi:hypothetical protein